MITEQQIIDLEAKYSGGKITLNLPMWEKSPNDPAALPRSVFDGHRMRRDGDSRAHGYAKTYAKIINAMPAPKIVVELGVLRGMGLAIWCDLFPDARVIGLDWDLSKWASHSATLIERGAFLRNSPEVHQFDELAPDIEQTMARILDGARIDFFIDDALHRDDANLYVFRKLSPFMSQNGVYVIEDSVTIPNVLACKYATLNIRREGALTWISSLMGGN